MTLYESRYLKVKTGRQEEKLNFKPESFSQKLQKYCEPDTETFKYVFLSDLSAQT